MQHNRLKFLNVNKRLSVSDNCTLTVIIQGQYQYSNILTLLALMRHFLVTVTPHNGLWHTGFSVASPQNTISLKFSFYINITCTLELTLVTYLFIRDLTFFLKKLKKQVQLPTEFGPLLH